MKKIASVAFLLLASLFASAQKFDYNVNFDYLLNNCEHGISRYFIDGVPYYPYQYSHTLHGVRLTPEAGVLLTQTPSLFHRLRVGIDVFKQMGEGRENLGLFREIILYYNIDAMFPGGGRLEGFAGCFPRRFCSGTGYWGPVFDSEYAWLDNNIEGFLVKYSRSSKIRAELVLDWPGMGGDAASPWRRERFQALTDGSWRFAGDFYLGWTGSFYHFAKAPNLDNVVDNHLLNPRLEWAPFTWLDEFRLELGGIFTYQCDRAVSSSVQFPMGLWSRQTVGKWDVTLSNRFYWGDDLMPLYDGSMSGVPYGRDLYHGAAGFHTLSSVPGWADWLTLAYCPRIAKWLSIDVAFTFHFGTPSGSLGFGVFRGCDQRLGVRVDLDTLRPHPKKPYRSRRYVREDKDKDNKI